MPKGILLHGPPGTGKTLLAKAVAHESGRELLQPVGLLVRRDVRRPRRGPDPAAVQARRASNAPAIIFIDELDAVGAHRGSDISGERDQTLNQLLVEMDGFDARDNVDRDGGLEPAREARQGAAAPGALRPPGVRPAARHARPRARSSASTPAASRSPRTSTSSGSPATPPGLTGADLANLCNEAAILAGATSATFITQSDFDDAFERVVAGLQSRKVITDHEKRVVAWHEAGHALVSELLPSVDKVQKVSIVPRGKALGYTLNLPQEDRYLKSREELIDYMKVLLAGRVSEQITFGRITTGASDDLKRVTDDRPRRWSTSTAWGPRSARTRCPADDFNVSEALRQTPRRGGQEIAEEAYRGAYRAAHRPPRPARRDRRAAARQRGHRARRDPRDHGWWPHPRRAHRRPCRARAAGGGRSRRGPRHEAARARAALAHETGRGCPGDSLTRNAAHRRELCRSPSQASPSASSAFCT